MERIDHRWPRTVLTFDNQPFMNQGGLVQTEINLILRACVESLIALIVASTIFPACMFTSILSPTADCRSNFSFAIGTQPRTLQLPFSDGSRNDYLNFLRICTFISARIYRCGRVIVSQPVNDCAIRVGQPRNRCRVDLRITRTARIAAVYVVSGRGR